MAVDSSFTSQSTNTNWFLDIVDTWCQHLPPCGASSPWFSSPSPPASAHKKKPILETVDIDTVATASTTQPDEEGSASATDSPASGKRAVTFGTLQVREYERIVDSAIYMGLSLGWDCTDHTPQPIRPRTVVTTSTTHRSPHALHSTTGSGAITGGDTLHVRKKHNGERFAIFLAYGFTRKELKTEANKAAKVWRQRQLETIRKEEEQMALEATTKRVERKKKASAMRGNNAGTTSSKRRAVLFSMFRH